LARAGLTARSLIAAALAALIVTTVLVFLVVTVLPSARAAATAISLLWGVLCFGRHGFAWVSVIRTARRFWGNESPAMQERTCAQLPGRSTDSFLLLGQVSATIAEEDLKGSIAGNLHRHP
jgi:hypothetical protein